MHCSLGSSYHPLSYIRIDWMSILSSSNLLPEEDGAFFCGGDCDVLWALETGGIPDGACFGEPRFMGHAVHAPNLPLILGQTIDCSPTQLFLLQIIAVWFFRHRYFCFHLLLLQESLSTSSRIATSGSVVNSRYLARWSLLHQWLRLWFYCGVSVAMAVALRWCASPCCERIRCNLKGHSGLFV